MKRQFPSDPAVNKTEVNTSISQQYAHSTSSFESQISTSKPIGNEITNSKSTEKRSNDHNIEITVSDPTKVGEVCLLLIYFLL